MRREKKPRTRWRDAKEKEREGLKQLYEELKKKHCNQLRKQKRKNRRKEIEKNYHGFINNPY